MEFYITTGMDNGYPNTLNLKNIVGKIQLLDTPMGKITNDLAMIGKMEFKPRGYKYTDEETGEEKFVLTSFDAIPIPPR